MNPHYYQPAPPAPSKKPIVLIIITVLAVVLLIAVTTLYLLQLHASASESKSASPSSLSAAGLAAQAAWDEQSYLDQQTVCEVWNTDRAAALDAAASSVDSNADAEVLDALSNLLDEEC